jgi:hypothetical protein
MKKKVYNIKKVNHTKSKAHNNNEYWWLYEKVICTSIKNYLMFRTQVFQERQFSWKAS